MTAEELLSKLRAEVERIKESYEVYLARITKEDVLNDLDDFLYFIDTIEKEDKYQLQMKIYSYLLKSASGDYYHKFTTRDYKDVYDFMKNEAEGEYLAWKVEWNPAYGEFDETRIDYALYEKNEFELPSELVDELKLLKRYTGSPSSFMDVSFVEEIVRLKSLRSNENTLMPSLKPVVMDFIGFLDKNRREGKMCLSNGECEDIEKAFREQDWEKLGRYIRKYIGSEEND